MYRSQLYFEEAKKRFSDEDVPPIFVPSYNRPDPVILKHLEVEPELKIVLCIRREQYEMYKKWQGKVYSIMLLDNVHEIGETRQRIIENIGDSFDQIFMWDDDMLRIDYTLPSITSKGTKAMRRAGVHFHRPEDRWTDLLKLWMYYMEDTKLSNIAISSPLYRPESWQLKYENAPMKVNHNACIQCVWLNLKFMREHNINYHPNYICGNEDYALQFDIMSAGGLAVTITDMLYECPPINTQPGGCENANGYKDPVERYKWYVSIAKKFYNNHPGILYKKTNSGKFESVKFNWKYWKKDKEETSKLIQEYLWSE